MTLPNRLAIAAYLLTCIAVPALLSWGWVTLMEARYGW